MESKIEKLKKWLDEKPANWWGTSKTMSHIWGKVCMLVAEEQAESHPATLEPLAAKMAYDREWLYEVSSSGGFYWRIMLRPRTIKQGIGVDFYGHTYSECESKARKYLESLPTKGEEQEARAYLETLNDKGDK